MPGLNVFGGIGTNKNYLCSRRVYRDIVRHSCESRNPENVLPGILDARLRWRDERKNTLTPQLLCKVRGFGDEILDICCLSADTLNLV